MQADDAVGPRAVIHGDLLSQAFGQFLPHDAPDEINTAARRERHDQAYRLNRELLCRHRLRCKQHGAKDEVASNICEHDSSSDNEQVYSPELGGRKC